jgi:hypothetical protein
MEGNSIIGTFTKHALCCIVMLLLLMHDIYYYLSVSILHLDERLCS